MNIVEKYNISPVLIIGIIAILLSGLGIVAFSYKKPLKEVKKTVQVDPYGDWQTFSDSSYSFTLRFPNNWKTEKNTSDTAKTMGITSPLTQKNIADINQKYGDGSCPVCGPNLVISEYTSIADEPSNVLGSFNATTIDDLISKQSATKQKIGTRRLNGREATEVIDTERGTHYSVWLTGDDGRLYVLFYTYKKSAEKLSEEDQKIIQSFKIGNGKIGS